MTLTHHKTAQEEAQEWRGQKESPFCAHNPHGFEVLFILIHKSQLNSVWDPFVQCMRKLISSFIVQGTYDMWHMTAVSSTSKHVRSLLMSSLSLCH